MANNNEFANQPSSETDDECENYNFDEYFKDDFGVSGLAATFESVNDIENPVIEAVDGGWSNHQLVLDSSVPLPREDVNYADLRPSFAIPTNKFDIGSATGKLYNCLETSGGEIELAELPSAQEEDPGANGDGCDDNEEENLEESQVTGAGGEQVVEVDGKGAEPVPGNSRQQNQSSTIEEDIISGGTAEEMRNGKRSGNTSQAGPRPKRTRGGEKKPKKGDRNLEDYDEDHPEFKTTKDAINSKLNRNKKKAEMGKLVQENSLLKKENETLKQENQDLQEELKSERMSNQSSNGGTRVINNIDPSSGAKVNCITLKSTPLPGAAGNEQIVTAELEFRIPSLPK